MKLTITAFGIAKDIIKAREIKYTFIGGDTIKSLKSSLISVYPSFEKLASLNFAVHEAYQSDDFVLQEGDHVVIIPPVSGG